MLSVAVIGGSGGGGRSAGYYTSSVAKGRDDYYTGKGEAPGECFGAGSEAMGLAGEVDGEQFRKVVMEAVDPVSGPPLRGGLLVNGTPVSTMAIVAPLPVANACAASD